ncbi:glycosyltransferase family 4 protein [Flavobacterium antarcticum]|uniref:MraY family glycosyltransferase n=1 Tax=Flavobacterium antarcticum TaxID=271155 RepID=UPI0003B5A990|nr:glycosyltransferase family 4 protein [Flavobacterium antarcticum]
MIYIIVAIVLFVVELIYFRVADKFNIIDHPNERSSHSEVTLRGGGIIFWFASLFYFMQNPQESYLFFIGITIVSLVSFWDDIRSLSNKIRIIAHFLAITLIFYNLDIFEVLPIALIAISYIISIGIINAYNFMDGINGITGIYTLVVLSSLLYINEYVITFENKDFIIYPILASIVFLFFNFRKRAKCFAGDIGSIAIAFWVIFLILKLMLVTNSFVWILLLLVYGVDTIGTILHRLYLKQNIFEAHRLHFYQILSNEYKLQHRVVSGVYGCIQIIVSGLVICLFHKINDLALILLLAIPALLIYLLKFYFIKLSVRKIN